MATSRTAQRRNAKVTTVPSPYGGLNDSEPLAAMGNKYALLLDNILAGSLTIRVRPGYRRWVTGIGSPVQTLVNYAKLDGTEELFAATSDGLYDVTSSLDVPPKVADLTSGVVTFTHFSNIAGNYLVVANGIDPVLLYDGTTWAPFTASETPTSPGQIKGVDPALLTVPLAYKNRLWFIQKDSLTAWYLPTDAVGGEAKAFLLGSIFNRGGNLVQHFTWSLDSGEGLDDNLVFQSSGGEVAIYTGNDPAVADSWTLQSVYYSSPPMGPRSSDDFGGDVVLLTKMGVLTLSTIVEGDLSKDEQEVSLSKKISRQLNVLANTLASTPNWEVHNVPSLQALVVIIPESSEYAGTQYVMNNITNAWTRFTAPAVLCGRLFRGKFMFGGSNGTVYLYGSTDLDDVHLDGTGGQPIRASLITAYDYMEDPTTNKNFKFIRPIFQSKSNPAIYTKILTDFSQDFLLEYPTIVQDTIGLSLWDEALWDIGYWETSQQIAFHNWRTVLGMGFCVSLNMNITATDAAQLTAIEWVFEDGGAI